MALGQTHIHLRKWGSLSTIILSTLAPGLYLTYFCTIPVLSMAVWYALALAISTFYLFHQVGISALSRSNRYRILNAKNSKENKILHMVNNLAEKLQILKPVIYMEFNKSIEPQLRAFAIGWPFRHQLVISEDLLKIYLKGLTHQSFEALLAHEMTHIKNADSAFGAMDSILSNTFRMLFVLSIFCSSSLFSLSLLGLALLGIVNELASAMLSRSLEMLADSGALHVTKKPNGVKRFLFDLYLQYLHWGKIVVENKYAREKWLMIDDPQREKLKTLSKQLSETNYARVYYSMLKISQHEQITSTENPSLLWQAPGIIYSHFNDLKEYGFTWFNSHPTLEERLKNLSTRLS